MRIDLHVHSTFSDGVYSPSDLVEMAVERQVSVLSIADHDCIDAIPEALEAAGGKGLEVVSGVELSSEYYGRDLHVLGYGFDPENGKLKDMLQRFRDTREKRGLKIIENLREQGVEIDPEYVLSLSPDGALGRPHIAEALIEEGYASNHNEAFSKYIGEHCRAYVKKFKLTPQQAIEYIRSSGGLAFIAHPGNYLEDNDRLEELISYGFDGVEVVHPNHSKDQTEQLMAIAQKFGLLMSGGTDFHGFSGKDVPIGEMEVPEEEWRRLRIELAKKGKARK